MSVSQVGSRVFNLASVLTPSGLLADAIGIRPVYWGSLAHQRSYPNKLDVLFVNRDASDIGNSIQAVVHADFLNTTHAKLGWRIRDPSQYPTDDAVQHAVLDERYWMAVVGEYTFKWTPKRVLLHG